MVSYVGRLCCLLSILVACVRRIELSRTVNGESPLTNSELACRRSRVQPYHTGNPKHQAHTTERLEIGKKIKKCRTSHHLSLRRVDRETAHRSTFFGFLVSEPVGGYRHFYVAKKELHRRIAHVSHLLFGNQWKVIT